jgi:hypothetical protein
VAFAERIQVQQQQQVLVFVCHVQNPFQSFEAHNWEVVEVDVEVEQGTLPQGVDPS